ncbi:MAG: anaerobic glycerol-3-phosphate dehydrogenase subunit A [Deltaproteobacteria bacterium]|nr:anaerobic glycerol-3-phosphate dehydrogenase subunit A [Deltaproteobacteria bacterium]
MKRGATVLETQVLIIGGGVTGTGLARDLALRGIGCVLAEKGDINAGASGANHGLLHSGARYVSDDPVSARQCMEEGEILRKVAPQCIDDRGGLFVAVRGDDERYVADFPGLCSRCGIPVRELSPEEAREREPLLSPKLIAAYQVRDASIDPFRLTLENIGHARKLGARFLPHTGVVGFERHNGILEAVRLSDRRTGTEIRIRADQVVNASGAWAREVAAMAGASIPMVYSKGTLLVAQQRLAECVVNRLRPPSDGDILVPGGTVSILGTTSIRLDTLEEIVPSVEEVDFLVEQGSAMLPALETMRYVRAFSGVRPLIGRVQSGDDRSLSRGFALLHHLPDGLENFITIAGGKLTTYRLMAEKAADLVTERLGISAPCRTGHEPLPPGDTCRWTEPGLSPRIWIRGHDPEDGLLCECEMVSRSAVDSLVASLQEEGFRPDLSTLSLRSRIGKGACQGTFCGTQVTAYLCDRGHLEEDAGLVGLRSFLEERWKGTRSILWDRPLTQAELQEALYCGYFCLELREGSPQ